MSPLSEQAPKRPSKILMSADSTCDLSPQLKGRYNVHYYPFHIILEGVDYQDNVDIVPDTIFKAYRERGVLPQTSAINELEYVNYFKPFVDDGYEIIHINLGAAISSAHQHCVSAARDVGHVYPVDSRSLSTGLGLLIIVAGDMIEKGASAAEIASTLRTLTANVHASFILDTLDFMHAGGRCSTVTALLASAINMKPCIEVSNADGSMAVGKKYRGKLEKVLKRYTKDKLGQYKDIRTDHLFITHTSIDPSLVDVVRETALSILPFENVHDTDASCTIGSHCGPGTLGILFMTETPSK